MRFQEIGNSIREARTKRGLTQAELASRAGISRTTLNQLENGVFPDLGVKKVQNVLGLLDLDLAIVQAGRKRKPDFVRMAAQTASVSYRETLTEDELVHALLSGKVPRKRHAHFITLLDESPPVLLEGLVEEVEKWSKPGRVTANLRKIAREVGASRKVDSWLRNDRKRLAGPDPG